MSDEMLSTFGNSNPRSVFRVDSDYAARRHARKFLGINDPDYYEWETHIFFDGAFKVTDRYPHFSLYLPYK